MIESSRRVLRVPPAQHGEDLADAGLRVISWNLLRLIGAGVEDVAALIRRYEPDVLLMQEATPGIAALPELVGGHLVRAPMANRVYGLAVWSRNPLPPHETLALPVSKMPGRVPPRIAQLVRIAGITFANVHLSHGQLLNRRQLLSIVRAVDGPLAIIGDYNAVGPIVLSGFRDLGPQRRTHHASNIIPFRLDRCMARGLHCTATEVLERGPSDHHPILLELSPLSAVEAAERAVRRLFRFNRSESVERVNAWVRRVSQSPERIRVPRALLAARRRVSRRRATRAASDDGAQG